MSFQIKALDADQFAHLFSLSDEQLADRNASRVKVEEYPGTPCRISLEDTPVGEEVILLNFEHLSARSPFQSRHAIFVRNHQSTAKLAINALPEAISRRVISVRGFDEQHMMIAADLATGDEIAETIDTFFTNGAVAYIHLHNAKLGCFAATVERAEI